MSDKPSLIDTLCGKPFVAKREVVGKQVEFRVLSNPERMAIWKRSPSTDLMSMSEAAVIPTLARAVVTIDGRAWKDFDEIQELERGNPRTPTVDLVEQHLSGDYPFTVLDQLYSAYSTVVEEHQGYLKDLKKNSVKTIQEESGSSAKPSEQPRVS